MEPMYSGTPQSIIDALPALLNNIKMMHSIARYYNTPERMTTLFVKVGLDVQIFNEKDDQYLFCLSLPPSFFLGGGEKKIIMTRIYKPYFL